MYVLFFSILLLRNEIIHFDNLNVPNLNTAKHPTWVFWEQRYSHTSESKHGPLHPKAQVFNDVSILESSREFFKTCSKSDLVNQNLIWGGGHKSFHNSYLQAIITLFLLQAGINIPGNLCSSSYSLEPMTDGYRGENHLCLCWHLGCDLYHPQDSMTRMSKLPSVGAAW